MIYYRVEFRDNHRKLWITFETEGTLKNHERLLAALKSELQATRSVTERKYLTPVLSFWKDEGWNSEAEQEAAFAAISRVLREYGIEARRHGEEPMPVMQLPPGTVRPQTLAEFVGDLLAGPVGFRARTITVHFEPDGSATVSIGAVE